MHRKLVAGNWKMNGTLAANTVLFAEIKAALGRPAVTLPSVSIALFAQSRSELAATSIAWGGQDMSSHESGAYTGEVAAAMLLDFGCTYVIVGHSERRANHGETDALVAQKVIRALIAA